MISKKCFIIEDGPSIANTALSLIIIEEAYDSSYSNDLPLKQWDCFEVIDIPYEDA